MSVPLGTIDDAAAVGGKVDATLLLGSVGHLLGGLIVDRCHINIAMHHESHFLATGRQTDFGGAVAADLAHQVAVVAVGADADLHLLGLSAGLQRVYLAVVAVADGAVLGHGEEAYGILLMVCELLLAGAVDVAAVDIEGAVFLTQIVVRPVVGPARGAVLALKAAQLGVFPILAEPDVTADGRLMVLAERVLIAFPVVIKYVAVAVQAHILHHER